MTVGEFQAPGSLKDRNLLLCMVFIFQLFFAEVCEDKEVKDCHWEEHEVCEDKEVKDCHEEHNEVCEESNMKNCHVEHHDVCKSFLIKVPRIEKIKIPFKRCRSSYHHNH